MKAHRGKLVGGLIAAACLVLSWWQQQNATTAPSNDEQPSLGTIDLGKEPVGTMAEPQNPAAEPKNLPAAQIKAASATIEAKPGKPAQAEPKPPQNDAPKVTANPIMAKMQSLPLRYTRHARCRMDCRKITEAEVKEILRSGRIDNKRTRKNPGQCTTYAVEGTTKADNQHVRIVYAACDDVTKVVTTIDLDTDHPCGSC